MDMIVVALKRKITYEWLCEIVSRSSLSENS